LYKEVFFGGTVSDETKTEVKERLDIGLNGLARLAKFSPFIAGDTYTAADIVAWLHFFMISAASQKIYGADLLASHIPQVADYMQFIETRPAVQKVAVDRAAAMAAFLKFTKN
jgi:glutathione S-transferase